MSARTLLGAKRAATVREYRRMANDSPPQDRRRVVTVVWGVTVWHRRYVSGPNGMYWKPWKIDQSSDAHAVIPIKGSLAYGNPEFGHYPNEGDV